MTDGTPPPWTLAFVGETRRERETAEAGRTVSTIDGPRGFVATVRVRDALGLDAERLVEATISAYRTLGAMLAERPELEALRLWNFIPGILDPIGGYAARYLAFNVGRFEGLRSWPAGPGQSGERLPTASGVGATTPDLIVHMLAADRRPVPVENPRQIPAYRYSCRYGPRPPCFSRAVRLPPGDRPEDAALLIGGTASVVGEETLHPGALAPQIDETMKNIAELVTAGLPEAAVGPLATLRQAIVYYVRETDLPEIEREVRARLPGVAGPEFLRTRLCREELLVEVEGVAAIRQIGPPV